MSLSREVPISQVSEIGASEAAWYSGVRHALPPALRARRATTPITRKEKPTARSVSRLAPCEVDRQPEEQESEADEDPADRPERLQGALRRRQLVGLHDLDRGRPRGQLAGEFAGESEVGRQLGHRAVRSRVTTPSAVDTNCPLSSSRSMSFAWAARFAASHAACACPLLKRLVRGAVRELPQAAREGAGKRLGLRRELRGDLALDVDVVEQGRDQEVADGVTDGLVLEQLAAGVDPGVGLSA